MVKVKFIPLCIVFASSLTLLYYSSKYTQTINFNNYEVSRKHFTQLLPKNSK